jgi:hypothetical protein
MKIVFMMMFIFVLASCGKDSGGSGSSTPSTESTRGRQTELTRNGYVDTSSRGETDLLNVTLNAGININGDRITFDRGVQAMDRGSRLSCSFSVQSGEMWTFSITGESLRLTLSSGKILNMRKLSGPENSILGNWLWQGSEDGMRLFRRLSILENRMIINQDCEG